MFPSIQCTKHRFIALLCQYFDMVTVKILLKSCQLQGIADLTHVSSSFVLPPFLLFPPTLTVCHSSLFNLYLVTWSCFIYNILLPVFACSLLYLEPKFQPFGPSAFLSTFLVLFLYPILSYHLILVSEHCLFFQTADYLPVPFWICLFISGSCLMLTSACLNRL